MNRLSSSVMLFLICGLLFFFTEVEGGFFTVKFDSLLLKEAVLEADCILPPLRQDDSESSSDSEGDSEQCEAYAKGQLFVFCNKTAPVVCTHTNKHCFVLFHVNAARFYLFDSFQSRF